eukprot:SAG25_NODE_13609_length_265_cov_0.626506_1_plen_53_part_10
MPETPRGVAQSLELHDNQLDEWPKLGSHPCLTKCVDPCVLLLVTVLSLNPVCR